MKERMKISGVNELFLEVGIFLSNIQTINQANTEDINLTSVPDYGIVKTSPNGKHLQTAKFHTTELK